MGVDLHIHSKASDGTFSPREIIERAKKIGLNCVALTDHDTVGGIEEAVQAAKQVEVRFVPGIELTALDRGREIHILGYFIDHKSEVLSAHIERTRAKIFRRMHMIMDKLRALGFELEFEALKAEAEGDVVGRPHIARLMQKKGYIRDYQEAFDKFIGEGGPAYVGVGDAVTPQDVYQVIHESGGIAVLAHPGLAGRAEMMDDDDIFNHKLWGAEGIEVYHPRHDRYLVSFYTQLARRYEMVISGGSDCHGDYYSKVLMEHYHVPDWVGEKLIEFHRQWLRERASR